VFGFVMVLAVVYDGHKMLVCAVAVITGVFGCVMVLAV